MVVADGTDRASCPEVQVTPGGLPPFELVEHLTLLGLLTVWAVPFTRAIGGRGVHHELIFAAVLAVAIALARAWLAPVGSVVLAAIVAAAALLVCVFAPTGWWGSDVAAGYAIGASVYVVARRYVRDEQRRDLIAAAICLASVYEFSQGFISWVRTGDPATEMSGTFYWHNPYAAYLLPGAVIGLGLVAGRRRPWSLIGWVSVPLCTAGVVLSSSRATMLPLVVALVLVTAGVAARSGLARVGGVLVLSVGALVVLPGPPFFSHRVAPWAPTAVRAQGQTLAQNGGYRTEFWREGAQVFLHHPVVGSGYHALATASVLYTPVGWARSSLTHDGYLQALSDGGLLLGVPFLVAVATVAWWALRRFLTLARKRRSGGVDPVELAIVLALLAGMAHSAVDFDWSHPALLVQAALLAACVAPAGPGRSSAGRRWCAAGAALALTGVLIAILPALHQWQRDQPNDTHTTASLLADASATFGDYRPAAALVSMANSRTRVLTPLEAAEALRLTANEASVDPGLSLARDELGARMGLLPGAASAAEREVARLSGGATVYDADLAAVLGSAGELDTARRLLAADIARQANAGEASPDLSQELGVWASTLGRGRGYACQIALIRPLLGSWRTAGLPRPSASCRGTVKDADSASEQ